MGRFLVVILVMASLARPDVRAHLAPHLLSRVQPALDGLYRWSAQSRVEEIAGALRAQAAMGRAIPDPGELRDFVDRYYSLDGAALDPWDTPYYLVHERGALRIASAGPDRRPHSADDLISTPVGPEHR